MGSFDRNLGIVLEFASRVNLYGDREAVLASLRALQLTEARAACTRARIACHKDFESRGYSRRDIFEAPVYRRLIHLDEMIDDLSDSLRRKVQIRQVG